MKKIDTRKSTIYTGNIGSISSCLDAGCLGAKGYFTNVGDCMCDTDIQEGTLKKVIADKYFNNPYVSDVSPLGYKFFIPFDELVFIEEQPAKKYRPFTYMNELPFKVGDTVAIRLKDAPDTVYTIVTEIISNGNKITYLSFGTTLSKFSPIHYFINGYEISMNGEWVPFGVEE